MKKEFETPTVEKMNFKVSDQSMCNANTSNQIKDDKGISATESIVTSAVEE